MRLILVALLFAISYAQTVYRLQRPRVQLRRPRAAGGNNFVIPWDDIKSIVDQITATTTQRPAPYYSHPASGGNNGFANNQQWNQPQDQQWNQQWNPTAQDRWYQPQSYWYHPEAEAPEAGEGIGFHPMFNFHGGEGGEMSEMGENSWGPHSQTKGEMPENGHLPHFMPPFHGPSSGNQQNGHNQGSNNKPRRPPPALLTTPCGAHTTPWECMSGGEESCTWTKNSQYEACVGEGTPCEVLDQAVCSQIGEGESCTWDMEGLSCYGELTPCHKLLSQTACTTSAGECEWSPEGQSCFSESTPCPAIRKQPVCALLEDCYWDIHSRSCMMGEAPEMLLNAIHQPTRSDSRKPLTFDEVFLASFGGFSVAILLFFIVRFGFRKRIESKGNDDTLLGNASPVL